MDMRVNTAHSDNLPFRINNVRIRTNNHRGGDCIHRTGIPSVPNTNNNTIFDTNIRLGNVGPVNDHSIHNRQIGAFRIRTPTRLHLSILIVFPYMYDFSQFSPTGL